MGAGKFRSCCKGEEALKYSSVGGKRTGGLRQSQLNVIAGVARGIKLLMPPDDGVRPTIGRAREAVFASAGDISGLTFWDLFAGSGANGCEAASRGASAVVFVEMDKRHCLCIEENIRRITDAGVRSDITLCRENAEVFSGSGLPEPDIIFADPPYSESGLWFRKLVPAFVEKFPQCNIIWEVPSLPGAPGEFIEAGALEYGFQLKIFGGTRFFVKNRTKGQYL